jgi:mono/diheme cytochrome c family protein
MSRQDRASASKGENVPILLALALLALAPLALAPPARAAGDAGEGRALAQRWCVSCHGGSDAAPPLETIANRPDRTPGTLRAWLTDTHPPMPDLALSRREIDDLLAHLETLRKAR